MMKVLYVKPGTRPEVREIENTLKVVQETVGGYFQPVYLDDGIILNCNEEGKINGMWPNRAIKDESGVVVDVIYGPFFLCSEGEDGEFASLSEEQIEKYSALFRYPEIFMMDGSRIQAIPVTA